MLITGPILMFFPQMTFDLYDIVDPPSSSSIRALQWFGALVLLMGWTETRKLGKLDAPEVEAWLIADIFYAYWMYCFVADGSTHGWNFWSVFSIAFPILWAPVRLFWLFSDRKY